MSPSVPPQGAVTILFTDVKDSSRIKQAPGIGNDLYRREMLEPHFARLRTAIAANSGYEYGTPAGDSLMVVFPFPDDALACAAAMQQQLADPPIARTDGNGREWKMVVRIGVHAAAQQYRPDQYGGSDADFAARVMSLGDGGQILVSERTRTAAQNWENYAFHSWPNRYLKSFDQQPETIYELLWYPAQQPQEPGLRWLPDWYGRELNKFVGREELLREIRQWLEESRYPLYTLQGPGGIGKTRLAVETVLGVCGLFAGGTAFVALDRELTGAPAKVTCEMLASAIARAVEAPAEVQRDAETRLIPYLREERLHSPARALLLILDNWESASNSQTRRWLGDLLQAVPPLRCLATSRVKMGLTHIGEVSDIPPLRIPERLDQSFEDFEGYNLFVERARQRAPGAVFTDRDAVRRILQATGGSALGIELVAARVVDYPRALNRIAVGLEQGRLEWQQTRSDLDDTRPDTERHASMEACLNWSFSLLPEEEQAAFPRLGLFAADFSPETAQELFSIPEDWLLRWRRHFLLEEADSAAFRFTLLPVVREYALLRLKLERARQEKEYVAYYARLAKAHQNINLPTHKAALDAEWRNALEAAEIAARADDWTALASLSYGLGWFFHLSVYGAEAARLHELARQAAAHAGDVLGQANCIRSLGAIALARSEHEDARQRYEQAKPLYEQVGSVLGQANCILSLGDIALARSEHERAGQLYEQALGMYERIPEPYSIGWTHRRLARLARNVGERQRHVQAARAAWESIRFDHLVRDLDAEFDSA